MEKVGAGEGCDGGGMIGETFGKEGEAVVVGVGRGVLLDDEGAVREVVDIDGWWKVGCCPV